MTKGMTGWLAAGVLLLAGAAQAEIYLCEDNGKKTYSQQPCGNNAKKVELQQSGNRITLPEELDGRAALDVCKMMVRSLDMAVQMRRQRIPMDRANDRVFGYLRENVTNFDEVVRNNPAAFDTFRRISQQLTSAAYSVDDLKPGEREAAVHQCVQGIAAGIEQEQGRPRRQQETTM